MHSYTFPILPPLIPATRWSCCRPLADSNDCRLQLHLVAEIRGAQISITGLVLSALSSLFKVSEGMVGREGVVWDYGGIVPIIWGGL